VSVSELQPGPGNWNEMVGIR